MNRDQAPGDLEPTLPLSAQTLDQDRVFTQALEEFVRYLKYEKLRQPNTVKAYQSDLIDFFSYLLRHGTRSLEDIDINLIRSWLAHQHKGSGARSSTARRSSTVRNFFAWAEEENLIDNNPTLTLASPKKEKYLPAVLSREQMNSIISGLENQLSQDPQDPNTLRNLAVVELLYASGLRISELCSLNLTSIDRANRTLRVIGKGNKERTVPFGKPAMLALENWVRRGRPQWFATGNRALEEALFIGPRGRRANPRQIREALTKLLAKVENTKASGAHVFRHTAATHMVDGGADIRAVQELLGHTSLATTQIYTHVSVERLAATYQKAHPRA